MSEPAVVLRLRGAALADGVDLVDDGLARIQVWRVLVDELAANVTQIFFGEDLRSELSSAMPVGIARVAR